MRVLRPLIAVALAFGLSAGAALAQVSPLWGSDQIRSARPMAPAQALVFDLHREVNRPGRPIGPVDQVVTLAPSFSLIAEGGRRILEDHALCRTLVWTEGGHTVGNDSCYAAVSVRDFEIRNRVMMARILQAAKTPEAMADIALSEAELNIAAPGAKPLTVRKTPSGTEYLAGKILVARVEGSAGALSAEEMHRLVRFFARDANLHPQARGGLAAGGQLPARIESNAGSAAGEQVFTLSHLRRVEVDYPLPVGLPSSLAEAARTGSTPRDLAVRRIAAVIAEGAPRPSVEALVAAMRKAAADGHDLQAILLFMELSQEHADLFRSTDPAARALAAEAAALLRRQMSGAGASAFMQASDLAGDSKMKGDRQAAARFLALSHQMDGLDFGTFRYVTYANLVAGAGDTKTWDPAIAKAMPANPADGFWLHIAAHPWAANAYKDVGDVYLTGYAMDQAWVAYDLGRAADPQWRVGVMPVLAKYEDGLRAAHPDFF
jgi:hypothetical protein